jgi:hypothetical protein
VWPVAGSGTTEVDPATGHVLRKIAPAVLGDYYSDQLPTLVVLPPRS